MKISPSFPVVGLTVFAEILDIEFDDDRVTIDKLLVVGMVSNGYVQGHVILEGFTLAGGIEDTDTTFYQEVALPLSISADDPGGYVSGYHDCGYWSDTYLDMPKILVALCEGAAQCIYLDLLIPDMPGGTPEVHPMISIPFCYKVAS